MYKPVNPQLPVVILPYVGAVNPKADPFIQALPRERLDMLEQFKSALDAAGIAYTGEVRHG